MESLTNMITLENFNLITIAWIALAIIIFPVTLFITAPYGRHTKITWGPMVNNRLGWVIMELPSLVIFAYFIIRSGNLTNIVVASAFSLWAIHYINRSLIFPFRIKTGNKKMPALIMLFAIIFNSMNGFLNGYWLAYFSEYNIEWIKSPRFILGVLIFIAGFFINQYHDKILIGLRKAGGKGYQVPYGGLFKYISCPNFLGEIIEWAGFVILAWNLPALAFLIWTMINLIPRALDHHKWYKKQFEDYPPNRKAILPFVL